MTTARLLPPPYAQFYDNSGNPLSGGKVYFYNTGTTTKGPVYKDPEGLTRHKNPVELDDSGRAIIYLDTSATYDIELYEMGSNATFRTLEGVKAAQSISMQSTHVSDIGTNPTSSGNTLPDNSIVSSWTSSASTDISLRTYDANHTLSVKNLQLGTDSYGDIRFNFDSGYGLADANNNELLKFTMNATPTSSDPLIIGMMFSDAAGSESTGQILNGQRSNSVTLRFLAKGSGNVYLNGYKFPNSNGSSGQKLQTNGSKVLSWA